MNQLDKNACRKKELARLAAAFNVCHEAHLENAEITSDFPPYPDGPLWPTLTPEEATNDFDYQFCHANDVIPDELRSMGGFKKAALMILVSQGFDQADHHMAVQHLKYAQQINVGVFDWVAILGAMEQLYYHHHELCSAYKEHLIELLAKHGWEWTGATYDQLDVPITQPDLM